MYFLFSVVVESVRVLISQQVNGGSPKAGDALSGELWEVKRERIRRASDYGNIPGWDLRSVSNAYHFFCFCFDDSMDFEQCELDNRYTHII